MAGPRSKDDVSVAVLRSPEGGSWREVAEPLRPRPPDVDGAMRGVAVALAVVKLDTLNRRPFSCSTILYQGELGSIREMMLLDQKIQTLS